MRFQVISDITEIRMIASGKSVRERKRLNKFHGRGRWRKMKGIASIRLTGGSIHLAEIHWYEAHGIGKKEQKIKRLLS